jgi:hypothetical protein
MINRFDMMLCSVAPFTNGYQCALPSGIVLDIDMMPQLRDDESEDIDMYVLPCLSSIGYLQTVFIASLD